MILVLKKKIINLKDYIRMFTTSLLRCMEKKSNIYKNISPTFKYLQIIEKIWL